MSDDQELTGAAVGFTLRDAHADERASIRELTMQAYGQYATIMAPTAWEGLHQALLAALASDGPGERIVAERGGAIIGSVMLFPPAAGSSGAGRMIWPELRLLAVAAEARGSGVGTALVQECVARARRSGAPALGLYTSGSMQAAMSLYERLGFERVPAYDFQPAGAELIRAYRLDL